MNISRILNKVFEGNKTIVLSVVIFAIVVGGFLWGIVPAGSAVWNLYEQNAALAIEIRTLSQKTAILSSLDQSSLRQNLKDVVAAIPADQSLPTLLATLDGISAQSRTTLSDVSLSGSETISSASANTPPPSAPRTKTAKNSAGANVVAYSASIQGALPQVQDFLRLSSNVRRLVGIRSFDITIGATASAQAKIEMETYFVPLPTQIGAIGSSVDTLSSAEEATIQKLASLPNLTVTAQLPPALIGGPVKANPFSP